MADTSGRLDLDAITRPWPHVDRQIDDLRAEVEQLTETVKAVHEVKISLTKSCFLDDEVRAAAEKHPGWTAWSEAYSRLFDIETNHG